VESVSVPRFHLSDLVIASSALWVEEGRYMTMRGEFMPRTLHA
jgi:hypothetical protein